MNWARAIRVLPLLPGAWLDCRLSEKKSEEERYAKCRRWSRRAVRFAGLDLQISGTENIPGTQKVYFVCNHQGTLDPALIISALPFPVAFISKKQNESLPVLGDWAKAIGTIHFDRESRKGNIYMLREAMRRLKKGKNLLIFPEGTRAKCEQMNPFHPQAFEPAAAMKAAVVPVCLRNAWCLDHPSGSNRVSVTFGKPIFPETYTGMTLEELSEKARGQIEEMQSAAAQNA